MMGINADMGGPPFCRLSAFHWKMSDGRKMFVWLGDHYGTAYAFSKSTAGSTAGRRARQQLCLSQISTAAGCAWANLSIAPVGAMSRMMLILHARHQWVRLLAYVTGLVNHRLLIQNEYLISENRILRSHLPQRLRLPDPERSTLAETGKRLGRKDHQLVGSNALPDTILVWYP